MILDPVGSSESNFTVLTLTVAELALTVAVGEPEEDVRSLTIISVTGPSDLDKRKIAFSILI